MTDIYGKSLGNGNFQPGYAAQDGSALNNAFTKMLQGGLSRQAGITATPGGTKAAAYQLTQSLNIVAVCATANDSVLLPKAIAGSVVLVRNSGADTLAVYGKGTDTIDGAATATADTIATAKGAVYFCVTTGAWVSILGA